MGLQTKWPAELVAYNQLSTDQLHAFTDICEAF